MNMKQNETFERPLASIGYASVVFLGVFFNFLLMVFSFFISQPSRSNPQGTTWFNIALWLVIPILGSFSFSLLLSAKMPRRIVVSPVYIMFFTSIPAFTLGTYVQFTMSSYDPESAMNSVFEHLFLSILIYMFLNYFSSLLMHPIVRRLFGAFAERHNIESGTNFYESSMPFGSIQSKTEDKRWLSEYCGMRIVEDKRKENIIKIKLNKYKTDFYLALYARNVGSKTSVSLTPYELKENPAEKLVRVSDDSKHFLEHQIGQIEKSLELVLIPAEKSAIFYDSVNYTMSPARFPAILKYRNQLIIAGIALLTMVIMTLIYHVGFIEIQTLVGVIAIIVALGSTAVNMLSKK